MLYFRRNGKIQYVDLQTSTLEKSAALVSMQFYNKDKFESLSFFPFSFHFLSDYLLSELTGGFIKLLPITKEDMCISARKRIFKGSVLESFYFSVVFKTEYRCLWC